MYSKEAEAQTLALYYVDTCTEPMDRPSRRSQTERLDSQQGKSKLDVKKVHIEEEVVEIILQTLAQMVQDDEFFAALDQLRKEEKVSLALFKTVAIPMTDKLPVVGLEYGGSRRVALLLGESRHDSWCTHTFGRIMVYQKGNFHSIYLQNCPTKAVFTPQNQVIIGTSSGQILLTQEGDILWNSADNIFHSQAITCFHWLSRNSLLSSGLDGKLVLSFLKSTSSLEIVRSTAISLSDLPKYLRKNNVTAQKAGIVALAGAGEEVYVAGETGALWTVHSTEKLEVKSVGYEKDGIENLTLAADILLLQTPVGDLKKKTRGSLQPVFLDKELRSSLPFVVYGSNLVLVVGEEEGVLLAYDLELDRMVMKEVIGGRVVGMGMSHKERVLVIVNAKMEMMFYDVVID